ncbi:hypothetical protein RvY_03962 [Ramazzottius varieornatus]|uniref:Uncharacterized protein n=1 Tax=Ramazzottius varieornatus TaxID=947166 RepID=A0A1D1UPW2_RAMVA|nr:hypothetical protein RvY_03962 [Ramazzottius varieornatus]
MTRLTVRLSCRASILHDSLAAGHRLGPIFRWVEPSDRSGPDFWSELARGKTESSRPSRSSIRLDRIIHPVGHH